MSVKQALRFEMWPASALTPHPLNWRVHPPEQREALTHVIDEVGWAGAVLYNERTKRILDGHLRQDIALRRDDEQVPVIIGDWDEDQEKLILASFDTIGGMAIPDVAKLSAVLDGMAVQNAPLLDALSQLAGSVSDLNFDGDYLDADGFADAALFNPEGEFSFVINLGRRDDSEEVKGQLRDLCERLGLTWRVKRG